MAFTSPQLRAKALMALEEAVQECRVRAPRRTLAVRFALAYLWSLRPGDRKPYDDLWKALGAEGIWRFSAADHALSCIYRQLEIARDDEIAMRLWRRQWAERERAKGEPPNPH
ncbi:MAG TPA: hypothetical protein VGT77_12315 [Sphingomonas sp.]|nr:hypothetical protein [Sphingomonas sp.]